MTTSTPHPFEGNDERPEVLDLWRNLTERKEALAELLKEIADHWVYEDGVYRMYHQSLKTWHLQSKTKKIVQALQDLRPRQPINSMFLKIFEEGTESDFRFEFNKDWLRHARPVVEAFLHAKYFLEMGVKYSNEFKAPPNMLPSGWAAFLYLYNLR